MNHTNRLAFSQTLICAAVLAAFGPARAQDIGELTSPAASVISAGAGIASGDDKDRARFGLYNGLREDSVNPLLGFRYVDRNAESGRWITFEGRNLGLDNREAGVSVRQLGDWKFSATYSELVRHDPRTINTGLIGAGSTTPTVVLLPATGTGSDLDLKLKRKSFLIEGDKWLGGNLQVEVSFKNEDKNGARLFGKGFVCASATAPGCTGPTAIATGWALLLLPEPVNSTIRQLDARLNWSSGKLNLSGGYYGSFYTNANGNISPNVPGVLANALGTPLPLSAGLQPILNLPMALQPDNQAHQVFLAGNYTFNPKLRFNFKYSYTHATQNDDFAGNGFTAGPAGVANLGGRMDTTRAQLGFSSHPFDKLHVHGDVKYEKRNDNTPIALYNLEGANGFTNTNNSPRKLHGTLEATYRLPQNFNATGGVFYEHEDFGQFTPTASVAGLSGIRQKLQETGYRAELSKLMSDNFTGRISYTYSHREGDSPWLKPRALPGTGVFEASDQCNSVGANACIYGRTSIFPFIFEDRKREKVRLMANWDPTDRLSLQFFVEDGKDRYFGPTEHGLRDTGMSMFSVDATYALSPAWKLTAYASHGQQTVHAGHSTGYDAALRDVNDSFGVGLQGKPSERFRTGADLIYLNDKLKYDQDYDPAASATNKLFLTEQGGLPDVTYKLIRLKLFGEYAVQKNSYIRLDFIHERTMFNEWTYNYNGTPFFYSDLTTINAKQRQNVSFLGVSYVYRFK